MNKVLLNPTPAVSSAGRSRSQPWICGIGTSVPAISTSQAQTLEFVLNRFNVSEQTKQLYKKTLSNKSILERHFSLSNLNDVLETDLDRKNNRFEREVVGLATNALKKALEDAGQSPSTIDFLVATTCTGYICPGVSAHLVETCDLRPDVRSVDLVGMGCGAAIPAMEQAVNFLAAHPDSTAAVVCSEVCSAAMFSNDDIDIVISNTIFSDGAAALILTNREKTEGKRSFPQAYVRSFESLMVPAWRETLRFRSENGHLRNVLGKNVPDQAAEAIQTIVDRLMQMTEIRRDEIKQWILHAGGDKVLNAIERKMSLPVSALDSSRAVLRNHGNMSSPTVLFVLEEQMRNKSPATGDWSFIGSFGAGFSAYGALLEWI